MRNNNLNIIKFEQLNNEDKKKFLDHYFVYEVRMLISSYNYISKKLFSDKKDLMNLILESFVLHARVLSEFFSNKRTFPDDARAKDFLKKDFRLNEVVKRKKETIDYINSKSNKQATHLTYTRINFEKAEKGWYFKKIFFDLLYIITLFINNIDENIKGKQLIYLDDEINYIRESEVGRRNIAKLELRRKAKKFLYSFIQHIREEKSKGNMV